MVSRSSTRSIRALARSLEGVAVLDVLEDGDDSGDVALRRGDVILSVDEARTRTTLDYVLATSTPSKTRTVIVFRDGNELKLRLARGGKLRRPSLVRLVFELIVQRRHR